MTVELVFETHSFTVDNELGLATGWLDGELSERGKTLAGALGDRRRDDAVATVFCSDLHRAVQTAEIAFAGTGIPIRLDSRLRECNYGEWNGMPVARLEQERSGRVSTAFPGGESFLDVAERMGRFLTEVARDWAGRRILVIGHTATRWSIDYHLDGVPMYQLVDAPFEWQEGWLYRLPDGWQPATQDALSFGGPDEC